jgi:hypothetical protein
MPEWLIMLLSVITILGVVLFVLWLSDRRNRNDDLRREFGEIFNVVLPELPLTEEQRRILRPVVRAKLDELRTEAANCNPFVPSGSERPTDAHDDLDALEKKTSAPQRFVRAFEIAWHFGVYSA